MQIGDRKIEIPDAFSNMKVFNEGYTLLSNREPNS